jgi:hypothetical protein
VATSWLFEYGPTTAYGSETALTDAGAAGTGQAVAVAVGGLSPATTYHYRLVGVRGGERFPGADVTFTTVSPPVVTPPIVEPPLPSLTARAKAARVACGRKRGKYRCRVSLKGGSKLRAKLALKRGRKVLARGSGRVGRLITLKGKRKAKAGRYTVKLTLIEGTKRASRAKRVRVR